MNITIGCKTFEAKGVAGARYGDHRIELVLKDADLDLAELAGHYGAADVVEAFGEDALREYLGMEDES